MSEKKETVNIVAGIDIGNGYTKGKITEPIRITWIFLQRWPTMMRLKKIEESRIPEIVKRHLQPDAGDD